ncbi:MAG: alanine acetyltransferase [Xanthomonadaceae bacterium]|jgi:hypothetical protein|nr:alanine acetyltransferase [Xanthomonadaceae bacterium]
MTPQQRQWLDVLGYTVYEQGTATAVPESVIDTVSFPISAETPGRSATSRLRPVSTATEARKETRKAVPDDSGSYRSLGRHLPDRLLLALLRASGCNPEHPETQKIIATWPVAELRGNPAAKRTFWPQLRTLRKQRRCT